MKKLLFAFSISSLLASTANAQSSVTLYGIVTGNVTYVNNAQTAATSASGRPKGGTQVAQFDSGSSGLASSRWGLKGVEDLGGGLKSIFQIEGGFSVNNGALGQGGAIFGRQAYVGLSAPQYGTFTLGRQGDASVEFVSPLIYGWYWGNLAIHPADYDNLNFTHRINNTLKYLSDTYRGFRFGGLYSLGGVAGNATQNQYWSLGANYTGGAFAIGASIFNARNPNVSLYGTNPNATTTGNNLGSAGSATTAESNPAIAGFASANSQQTVSVATTYAAGGAIFGVSYSNTQFRGLGTTAALNTLGYHGSTSLNTVGASLRYQATPFLRFGTSFDYTEGGSTSGKEGAKYEQVNLGAAYSLSKATDLYVTGAFQHASGTDSLGRPAVAAIGYLTPSATSKQVAVSAGIKHLF
ncbi:Outer membrane protein (porin) [Paraburkholderia fungorum]|uniref:Outer membrane protein (Porin) n=1 Tax=Paraburkholderia fungorum TaxID=134537 RepID=A0A1H1JF69_9BURK|nr:porin [Paraburkholderia fungorum]SDR48390.1 Outer membrane protein (porin) [Paraburkholderia fungorum]